MKSKTFTFWGWKILLLVGLIVSGASAETIIVDPNGFEDFNNIQEAINASWDGDTILVRQGTYNEDIHFNNRAVTLTSEDPNDPNIIESTTITGGVTFDWAETAESVLTGFTITTNGISCLGTSPTISKNIIRDCSSSGIQGGNPTIINNIITNNSSSSGGGICHCDGPITNNTITGNNVTGSSSGAFGGGIANCSGTISNNNIVNNTASDYNGYACGGGIFNCDGTITNNTISGNNVTSNNQYPSGGGLSSCDGTITNNTITGNTVTSNSESAYGGGLAGCGYDGTITNNMITGNNVTSTS